ncbi:MAG: enoyl-CoA hydratase/isomerase family protein [Smithellaceae bacterium]|nr:enoyl-CoA hydratase/isomerase family protein [Smithellaceae bacterium]
MDYTTITYREEEQIGYITLNRPHCLNALNQAMIEELEDLFAALPRNDGVRVLILSGAGEKGFCAGLDMKETAVSMMGRPPEEIYAWQSRTGMLYYKMRRLPQPVIAAVHGAASGAGFSFAMASDVRIISTDARFNAAYINIGLGGADLASSYFLPKLIGTGRAYEFLLTGDFMSAEEAMQLGFVSRMVPRDKLMEVAIEMARKMIAKSPVGLKMTKEVLNQTLDMCSLEQALHMENRNQAFMIAALQVKKSV